MGDLAPWAYMLIGAGALMVIGVAVLSIIEPEFRTALGQVLAALALGPTLLVVAATRSGPRVMPLSTAALKRFASQSTGEYGPGITPKDRAAWLLGYRGRGVIVLSRRRSNGWLNNAPNAAQRARTDTWNA